MINKYYIKQNIFSYKCNQNNYFKCLLYLLIFGLIVCTFFNIKTICQDQNLEQIEQQLTSQVDTNIEHIDFSDIDDLINKLENNILIGDNFKSFVSKIVKGQLFTDYSSFFDFIMQILSKQIISFIPILLLIICTSILCNIAINFKSSSNKSVNHITSLICFSVVVILVVVVFKNVLTVTSNAINLIKTQIDIIFPILLTLLTATGSVISVGIYKPIVTILSFITSNVFTNVLYPIFIISFIFLILTNMSSTVKLNSFNSFLSSTFKWSIGFVFTIYTGFLAIQGVSAGKFDSVSLTATKFAVKSYIPLIGGYLSDGLDYILLSSILVKNAVGIGAVFVLISTILSPIITIIVLKLGLQFTSGVLEPLGDSKISKFIEKCSKILIYPIIILLALSLMYFLTIGLIMCTSMIV